MNFSDEIKEQQGPKNHLQRVVFAVSTAVCIFAFQNCSSVDFARKAKEQADAKTPAPIEFQVEQASHAR